MRPAPCLSCCLALAATLALAAPAAADADTPGLSVELNRIDPVAGACRLTFVVENGLGAELGALALETVLIDTGGQVERLTLFDFGALPDGVPRVRQFDVPGLACEGLGRVLINGIAACEGVASCNGALRLHSRTGVAVIG
jgi:hypothetical protein